VVFDREYGRVGERCILNGGQHGRYLYGGDDRCPGGTQCRVGLLDVNTPVRDKVDIAINSFLMKIGRRSSTVIYAAWNFHRSHARNSIMVIMLTLLDYMTNTIIGWV